MNKGGVSDIRLPGLNGWILLWCVHVCVCLRAHKFQPNEIKKSGIKCLCPKDDDTSMLLVNASNKRGGRGGRGSGSGGERGGGGRVGRMS